MEELRKQYEECELEQSNIKKKLRNYRKRKSGRKKRQRQLIQTSYSQSIGMDYFLRLTQKN